ncbi:hypothetical protein HMPREF9004_0373 [Schaalia cardiffensis F0333]|uniref:Uncharacterized protein n=1 Tax=Schaalia cardiffensis F0333 TaxID=888050 RepID=N6XCS1_9ACTO|nr:hypothetical protein HMPREF9004_0373 [Schaalia cardiffensis F0333]
MSGHGLHEEGHSLGRVEQAPASLRGQARFIARVASRLRADIASAEGAHGLG